MRYGLYPLEIDFSDGLYFFVSKHPFDALFKATC